MKVPWRWAYVTLMVAALFCSESPKDAPIALGISLAAFAWLAFGWMMRLGPVPPGVPSFGLFMFFGAVVVSLPIAMLHDTSVRNWLLRGAAPFFFLLVYYLLPLRTEDDVRFVIRTMLFAFFVWAAKIVTTLVIGEESGLVVRWTAISYDLLFPFNLAALCILLLDRSLGKKIRAIGIPLFIVLTIGAGYRMHFLILLVFFSYYLLRNVSRGRLLAPITVIGCFAGALAGFASTEAGEVFVERFKEVTTETESARSKEIKYAFEQFTDSPVLGKGLGYPVPLDVAYYGFEEYLAGVAANIGSGYQNVSYIHNSLMQLLMNLGLFGTLAYALFMLPAIFGRAKAGHLLRGDLRSGCRWALFSILFFTLVAATITLFQFNLLVASLVAALVARRHTGTIEAEASTLIQMSPAVAPLAK